MTQPAGTIPTISVADAGPAPKRQPAAVGEPQHRGPQVCEDPRRERAGTDAHHDRIEFRSAHCCVCQQLLDGGSQHFSV